MSAARKPKIAPVDELLELLTDKARGGNVTAAKTVLAYHLAGEGKQPPADGWAELDELAERRKRARGGN
jgi:hypothetical protein